MNLEKITSFSKPSSLLSVSVLAVGLTLVTAPISATSVYAANCNFDDSNKRYRCNFTDGKWWKGDRAPAKLGTRTVHDDGESWYKTMTTDIVTSTESVQATRRTNFLDRAATDRLIR